MTHSNEPTVVTCVSGRHPNGTCWTVDHGDALPVEPDPVRGYIDKVDQYNLYMRMPGTERDTHAYIDHWLASSDTLDDILKVRFAIAKCKELSDRS